MKHSIAGLVAVWGLCLLPLSALAESALAIKPLAEKKVAGLPAGDLYWRIETFDSAATASAAAGPWSLPAVLDGKAWLFTLGSAGERSPNATKVADVGPIRRVDAKEYLLRINAASGAPGSMTPIHTHPGSEAYFVLSGEQTIRSARGLMVVKAGQAEPGRGANNPMLVSSSGSTDLHALVMFVVDASKPFSSPACFP